MEEGDAPSETGIMINTYARVIGAVRQQGDVKSIMIYKIHPVKSVNEVNTHLIEVVNSRYQAEEYHKGGSGNEGLKMEVEGGYADTHSSNQSGPQGKSLLIVNAIKISGEMNLERGVSIDELKQKFSQITMNELTGILEKLISDGHIYSTIDSKHFLACC